MIDFFSRLDYFFKSHGLKDGTVERECGIGNGLIGKARKRGSLSQENITKILMCEKEPYNKLNGAWLMTGRGEMECTLNIDPNSLSDEEVLQIINIVDLNIERFGQHKLFKRIVSEIKSRDFEVKVQKQIEELRKQLELIGKKS
ncbi:hypothetical protein [Flagellimonas nanhaiensis]|uniref:Uncharacterized protein n=1 Tax=Flagellimonas nanhaiensis TaxID=2292706 RepID=A0A371JNS9_9FLAO|nr:hypothetical protein [Allomuricauda nanhaiensis]RDY58899.1 hypothetical protein DX873_14670 [Allomuricauda nanhaiensis]